VFSKNFLPPDAVPQPEPYTGAVPGALHGLDLNISISPKTSSAIVLNSRGSDSLPGIMTLFENQSHALN
jgi:hypothetical protein